MKSRGLIIFLSVLIFVAPLISAQDVEIVIRDNYAPRETLQAEIYGNFLDDLQLENIEFYRDRRIALLYDILELENKHILYAILPSTEGSYSIRIKDIRYATDEGVSTETIIKEFDIIPAASPVLTVTPGFVVAKDDFHLKLKSDRNMQVDAEFSGKTQTISLVKNIPKTIYFSISGIEEYTETSVKIGDYEIPVFVFPSKLEVACSDSDNGLDFHSKGYVFSSEDGFSVWDECLNSSYLREFFCSEGSADSQIVFCQQGCNQGRCINDTPISCDDSCILGKKKCFGNYLQTCGNYDDDYCTEWGSSVYCAKGCEDARCTGDETIEIEETEKFRFSPLVLRATLPESNKYLFKVLLANLGNTDIRNIEISSDLDVDIEPDSISGLGAGEEKPIELTFKSETGGIFGDITADSESITTKLKIRIEITENESDFSFDTPLEEMSCSELGGKICGKDETCDGILTFTQEADRSILCCRGKCKKEDKKSSWTGIIIIAVVLVLVVLFFVIMRKIQKPKAEGILKNKQKKFEQRMKPVRGDLTKF